MKKRSDEARKLRTLLFVIFLLTICGKVHAQFYAVKADALGYVTGTFNLEGSMALNEKWSIHLPVQYNPWTFSDNKKLKQLTTLPGIRYWHKESYGSGWFFGGNAIISRYNVSGLFGSKYRYDGMAYGLGISAGYSIPIKRRWNIEFELGGGAVWSRWDKYPCARCGEKIKADNGIRFVPDKLAVSLVYLF